MSSPILVTKLFIPTIRPELVPRSRLIKQLCDGLHRNLTILSAPAGFGKTTLVTEWLTHLRGDATPAASLGSTHQKEPLKNRIAWLSLDEGDNDPTRFLTYFISALNHIQGLDTTLGAETLTMLQSPQPLHTEVVLTPLINEIAGLTGDAIPDKIILVLDDYHLIDTQPIHDALTFFLDNLPPQMHLVISTREDPLLPLSRLRARGQLTELRAADLRFTSTEAAKFLNQVMGLDLSTEDITALETRTEGWIAGLQLAAISLQGHADTSKLIQSFTGSNRLILDYLIDEVLNQQTEEIQNFLIYTSVLDRLTGSLCDAVRFGHAESPDTSTGAAPPNQKNGQAILEKLDRANLFVIPLDSERRWYRYHHLFGDLLRQRLRQIDPQKTPVLHARASIWYQENSFMDQAVEHAFSAADFERCAALMADLVDSLWKQGEHVKLRLWLEKLPDKWLCEKPYLCIYRAWFLFSTGQRERAEYYLQAAEQTLFTIDKESKSKLEIDPDQTLVEGRLSAFRAVIENWGKDVQAMKRQASLALELLPNRDPWRSMAEIALGDAYFFRNDMRASYQIRLETLQVSQAEDDPFFFMIANLKLATSLREMGQLERTVEICQQQLEFAKQKGLLQTGFAGWAMGLLGAVLAERNELKKALEYTTKNYELNIGGDLGFVAGSHLFLTRVQFSLGDFNSAESTLNNLTEIGRQHYLPYYNAGTLRALQARVYLAQNRLDAASLLVDELRLSPDGKILLMLEDGIVVRARLLFAQGKLEEAAGLLGSLIKAFEDGGTNLRLIEALVLQALTQQARGDLDQAMENLTKALMLAEPEGFIRIFVDEGPPMARLLFEALSQGIAPDYVPRLLAAFPIDEPEKATSLQAPVSETEWFEPLSEREIEVLQLIAEGLTNQEIGTKLYLSLNTIKAHSRTIYSKLDVHSRTQAVLKAKSLGIISGI